VADGTRGATLRARFAAIIGPALATAAVLVAQGCGPSATPVAPAATGRPAVTITTASHVFASYVTVSDAAAAADNEALALSVSADVQWAQVKAQFLAARRDGTRPPRYRYGTPVFYVPRLTTFPEWFAVAVSQRSAQAGTRAATLAGVPVTASGQALLIFERPATSDPWRLTGTARFEPGASLPVVQRDSAGYATALPTDGGSLLVPPDVVGPLQAAVVDDGPASPAARVVAAGPLTTGVHAAQASQAATHGDGYQWQLQGAGFTQFALRTSDGGALVLYSMYLNTTAGRQTLQFAATDPPAAARKPLIQVIGFGAGAALALVKPPLPGAAS
jgi:hypothetical protein